LKQNNWVVLCEKVIRAGGGGGAAGGVRAATEAYGEGCVCVCVCEHDSGD